MRFRILGEVPILGGAGLLGVGLGLGWALRHLVIEPTAMGVACEDAALAPFWCDPRTALIVALRHEAFRYLPVILGVLAWVPWRRIAGTSGLAAMPVAGLGMALYNSGPAILAVILAGLSLIRLEEQRPQASEFSQRTGQPGSGQQ